MHLQRRKNITFNGILRIQSTVLFLKERIGKILCRKHNSFRIILYIKRTLVCALNSKLNKKIQRIGIPPWWQNNWPKSKSHHGTIGKSLSWRSDTSNTSTLPSILAQILIHYVVNCDYLPKKSQFINKPKLWKR